MYKIFINIFISYNSSMFRYLSIIIRELFVC